MGGWVAGVAGDKGGRGAAVGAGVASPEAVTRLPEEREIGMSTGRSGSGGRAKRSENPAGLGGAVVPMMEAAGGEGGGAGRGGGGGGGSGASW